MSEETSLKIHIILAAGLLVSTAAQLSAQAPNPSTQAVETPTPHAAMNQAQGSSMVTKRVPRSPAVFGDCADDAWRKYSDPAFKSQKACERWVDKHVLASTTFSTPASAKPDPHPARTPPKG